MRGKKERRRKKGGNIRSRSRNGKGFGKVRTPQTYNY